MGLYTKMSCICLILLLTLSSCSGISIKKNVIGIEVPKIQKWRIGFQPLPEDSTGYYLTEEFQPVSDLNRVQQEFIDYIFYDIEYFKNHIPDSNDSLSGTIILKVNPSKTVSFPGTRYIVHQDKKNNIDCCDHLAVPSKPIVLIDKNAPVDKVKSTVKVKEVSLYVYNSNRQLIGEIIIKGGDIKPKHISKLITKHIIK